MHVLSVIKRVLLFKRPHVPQAVSRTWAYLNHGDGLRVFICIRALRCQAPLADHDDTPRARALTRGPSKANGGLQ